MQEKVKEFFWGLLKTSVSFFFFGLLFSDHLLCMVYISVIITHILRITNHAGPSVWAAIPIGMVQVNPCPLSGLALYQSS